MYNTYYIDILKQFHSLYVVRTEKFYLAHAQSKLQSLRLDRAASVRIWIFFTLDARDGHNLNKYIN